MRTHLRTGAVLLASVMLASACNGDTEKRAAATGEVDPDAVLKVATPAPFNNLDPARQTVVGDSMFTTLVFDRLVMTDAEDQLQPMLATEWRFAKDGSYLEFTLRDDVTFHDGTPFDARAVKANIERGQTLEGSTVKQYLESVESVEAIDATTVRLSLVAGHGAELPALMSTSVGMMVSPAMIEDPTVDLAQASESAGSGPYEVTSFSPSEKLVLKAAHNYWDPEARQLAGIEVEFASDAATRLNAVRTGSSDFAAISSASDVLQAEKLAEAGEVGLTKVTYRSVLGLMLNSSKGDMADPIARQAVAHAIDPEVISELFSGTCAPHRQIYPEGEWPAVPDYDYPYAFDQDKARELVDGLGGVSLELSFPAGSNVEQPANVLQSSLAEVGIDAQLNPVPVTESNARYQAGDFESLVTASFAPQADPAATVDVYLLGGFQLARTTAEKSEIEKLTGQGEDPRKTEEERAEIYRSAWETTLDKGWFVPICNITTGIVHDPMVMNTDNIPWATQGLQDLRYVAVSK
jgi:peptide/nickel transport system substrate-binding protein